MIPFQNSLSMPAVCKEDVDCTRALSQWVVDRCRVECALSHAALQWALVLVEGSFKSWQGLKDQEDFLEEVMLELCWEEPG